MDKREIKAIIESLLFIWGDPLSIEDISEILEMDKDELQIILKEMMDEFDYNRRGLRIIKMDDTFQIGTRPEHYDWIKKLHQQKPPKNLSNAAMETLSIIAYKQPVIKSDIEYIRGVKCDKAIETLMERNLVEEVGRLDRTGRPILYGTTSEFLKLFSLESLDDLPDLGEIEEKLNDDIEE